MILINPTQSQLEKFFIICGELMTSVTQVNGDSPNRTFIQKFFYTKGQADFDGKVWKLQWE